MGLRKLRDRFMDESYGIAMSGLFPKDNPKNTRFATNFFTSIGLGALTYVPHCSLVQFVCVWLCVCVLRALELALQIVLCVLLKPCRFFLVLSVRSCDCS